MMNLIIDKENLHQFVRSKNEDSDLHDECLRLLKRQMHVIFHFDEHILTDSSNKELLEDFIMFGYFTGAGNSDQKSSFEPQIFNRPMWEILSSVLLLNDQNYINNNGLLIGRIGEEHTILSSLFCNKNYDLHTIFDIQKWENHYAWNKMTEYILPCTDIVITDRYILRNQKERLKNSLYYILEQISKKHADLQINLVIFYDGFTIKPNKEKNSNGGIDRFIRKKEDYQTPKIDQTIKDITKQFKNLFGEKSYITFVSYKYLIDESFLPLLVEKEKNRPHDRIIITNNRMFRSGDSFCYFDEKDKLITQGKTLDIDSLANSEAHSIAESIRHDLQMICEENPYIFGDGISNFIDFSNCSVRPIKGIK